MTNSSVLEFLISVIALYRYIKAIVLFSHQSTCVRLSAKLSWNQAWTAQKYRVLQLEECFGWF